MKALMMSGFLLASVLTGQPADDSKNSNENQTEHATVNYAFSDESSSTFQYDTWYEGNVRYVKFKGRYHLMVHTSPEFYPLMNVYTEPGKLYFFQPGQWVHAKKMTNNQWVLIFDER